MWMGHEGFKEEGSAFEFTIDTCTLTHTYMPCNAEPMGAGWGVMEMDEGKWRVTVVSPKVSQMEFRFSTWMGLSFPRWVSALKSDCYAFQPGRPKHCIIIHNCVSRLYL